MWCHTCIYNINQVINILLICHCLMVKMAQTSTFILGKIQDCDLSAIYLLVANKFVFGEQVCVVELTTCISESITNKVLIRFEISGEQLYETCIDSV